ncbi:MAG: hypothetical protein M3R04_00665, partial [bacterium]|nr:hypothetical protein [bacterium]
MLLVPEQQAAQMERSVLEAVGQVFRPATDGGPEGPPHLVNSRVQVLSFRWLARRLELAAGETRSELSAGGRRLLVWKLLAEIDAVQFANRSVRSETATLLSGLLGELAHSGGDSKALQASAAGLATSCPQLAGKAALLAEVAQRFYAYCGREGLHVSAPAARIPALLSEENWPLLAGTHVWIDGFSSFTRAEEHALCALLERCESVTASLLLDPARVDGPADSDVYDWYAPTRKQYRRWGDLAGKAGLSFDSGTDIHALTAARRWSSGSLLGVLAVNGLQPGAASASPDGEDSGDWSESGHAGATPTVQATVCTDEHAEVEAAAREIRRLTLPEELGGGGLRYGQISVAVRSLAPYSDLLELAFARLGIPHFIDRRRSVAHHPACTLLRCGLRLALNLASRDDVYALLKCGLLGLAVGVEHSEMRRRTDLLENCAREAALPVDAWLTDEPWSRWPDSDDISDHNIELGTLDTWRRELLDPVTALHKGIAAMQTVTVEELLAQAWQHLFQENVRTELRNWATAADVQHPDLAELHSKALEQVVGLLDELVAVVGEQQLSLSESNTKYLTATELCLWVERGIGALSIGFPPPRLDRVLVTDIARGRHHEVAATLLLGLADDSWPLPLRQSAYFSDAERASLNSEEGTLLGDGAAVDSSVEPYLALVAVTRPTQYLWLSRPAADSEGRGRAPSPYYTGALNATGISEQVDPARGLEAATATCAADLVIAAALAPHDHALQSAALGVAASAADAMRGLEWARAHAESLPPLGSLLTAQLVNADGGIPEVEVRQLEALGGCPFKHYAQHLLRLQQRHAPLPAGITPTRLYRDLLQRTLRILRDQRYDWNTRDAIVIRAAANAAHAQLNTQLAERGASAQHLIARSQWLLERICGELMLMEAGRAPALLGA